MSKEYNSKTKRDTGFARTSLIDGILNESDYIGFSTRNHNILYHLSTFEYMLKNLHSCIYSILAFSGA